jgi:hypothetical protein
LSSAILFLAIVAIWACVLVPRWLRRSHEQAEGSQGLSGQDQAGQPEDAGAQGMAEDAAGTGDFDTLREQHAAVYGDPVAREDPRTAEHHGVWQNAGAGKGAVAWEDAEPPAVPGNRVEATYSVTATYSEEISYSADTAGTHSPGDFAANGEPSAPGAQPDRPRVAHPDGAADEAYHGYEAHEAYTRYERYCGTEPGHRYPQVPVHPPGPSAHVLQGRRRTLSLLVVIAVAAVGCAFVGLTPWWTCAAPFLMLGGYLLLLREAARADAERARSWAETRARAVQAARAAELARQRASRAHVASQARLTAQARPTAQIINLSALAQYEDQLYDQYADAEIRAVGD